MCVAMISLCYISELVAGGGPGVCCDPVILHYLSVLQFLCVTE